MTPEILQDMINKMSEHVDVNEGIVDVVLNQTYSSETGTMITTVQFMCCPMEDGTWEVDDYFIMQTGHDHKTDKSFKNVIKDWS